MADIYLCISCNLEVGPRQHAVSCDVCNEWQHRRCGTGISLQEYRVGMRAGEITFICRPCEERNWPDEHEIDADQTMQDPMQESLDVFMEADLRVADGTQVNNDVLVAEIPLDGSFDLQHRNTEVVVDTLETSIAILLLQVLQSLKAAMETSCVETVVLDFEKSAWQAVHDVFPEVVIKVCVFHWNQAIWRHVQGLGLVTTYRLREGVYNYIRQLMALPFLPSAHIRDTFDNLSGRANSEPLKDLVAYIDRQWMSNDSFPIASWSVFRQSVRTNNDVEGWHHRLNSKAGMCGLGVYRLIPLLQREAKLTELKISSGDLDRNRNATYRRLDERLTNAWDRYMTNDISTTTFLRTCSHFYGPTDD